MSAPRPRHAAQTRADILTAARHRFAADGYERTTLRGVAPARARAGGYERPPLGALAADVGIDAALVSRYFGNKQDLFATATEFRIELPDMSHVEPDDVASMLLPRYFAVWEDDQSFLALL